MYLKLYIRNSDVENWLKENGYKSKTILVITKEVLGFKNQREVVDKCFLDPYFLRSRVCWKTNSDYEEIVCILNDIVRYYQEKKPSYYRGRTLLDFVNKNGKLEFVSYWMTLNEGEPKSLSWFTPENTIRRWVREKF